MDPRRNTLTKIEAALQGLQPIDPGQPEDDEHEAFLLGLAKAPLTPQGQRVYQDMAREGFGVGMTEDGTLVYGPNEPAL